ncbi:hypothetical protein WG622_02560 [Cognatishimia sp. D5M38]|uniref:Killing trait domain-containing protein n=1 Tax=Cognatishimia coralii TaxID=3083254 RepID=A0ABU8QCG3_9RHOB
MSSSSSSSATSTTNADHRVAADGGSTAVSAGGDVSVHIVPDEAFEMGEAALMEMADLAHGSMNIGLAHSEVVADTLSEALFETQRSAKTEAAQLSETFIKMAIPAAALAFVAGKLLK